MSLTFNKLLKTVDLNPSDFKLVRHTKYYAEWREAYLKGELSEEFEDYQSKQGKTDVLNTPYIASFSRNHRGETLFVGLYKKNGTEQEHRDDEEGLLYRYNLSLLPELEEMRGLLVIDWRGGDGKNSPERVWHQYADNNEKPIKCIRELFEEPPFPGFHKFQHEINSIFDIPETWKTYLSNTQGIYLLTCNDTGKQYVGSASGDGGFFERWSQYQRSGHGGNTEMKPHKTSGYTVSMLEVVSSSIKDFSNIEKNWKKKLQTRIFGLNAN